MSVVTISDDVRAGAKPRNRLAREQAVRAGHRDPLHPPLAKPVQHLHDRAAVGDLVVEDDDVLAVDVADERVDDDPIVARGASCCRPPPAASRLRAKWEASFALPRSGETTTVFVSRCCRKCCGEHAQRVQVIDRHAEEAVHLRANAASSRARGSRRR